MIEKEEVLRFANDACSDPDVETLIVVAIKRDTSSKCRVSNFRNGPVATYALAAAAKVILDQSEASVAALLVGSS